VVQGGTVTVAPGNPVAAISGTFVAPYEVSVLPSWATDKIVLASDKLATQFTVRFTVLPAVASPVDWCVLDSA
jgi:hypothetical protein